MPIIETEQQTNQNVISGQEYLDAGATKELVGQLRGYAEGYNDGYDAGVAAGGGAASGSELTTVLPDWISAMVLPNSTAIIPTAVIPDGVLVVCGGPSPDNPSAWINRILEGDGQKNIAQFFSDSMLTTINFISSCGDNITVYVESQPITTEPTIQP